MRPAIPYIMCMIHVIYHSCSIVMTTFLFNGDDSQKHNFTTPMISQPLCIFFSSFLCFSLAQENVQNCGRLRLQSGGCFPIILLLPSSKKAIYVSLAPFCLGCLSQSAVAQQSPHLLLSRNHRLPLSFWCEIPHFWEQTTKKTPKSPSLAPNFFLPPSISSLTPQRALPFQPSLELLGVRLQAPGKDTCFPLHA